jgi:hypothetical protein
MPGAGSHPRPRVGKTRTTRVSTPRSRRDRPAFPHANGFNGFLRVLPGDRALLSPSPADRSANLISASGYQDRTTSPSTTSAFVSCASRVHRIPCPTSVTIAIRPSYGTGWRGSNPVSTNSRSRIFFGGGLDDPNHVEMLKEFSFSAQRPSSRIGLIPIEFVIGRRRPVTRR